MRKDMKKVIVTPGRVGGGGKYPRHRYRFELDDEDYEIIRERGTPKGRGMRKPHEQGWDTTKEQTDHLGPIIGLLKKNVGRKWNDVWSEICEFADTRDLMGDHLRRHVMWFVETATEINDKGEVVSKPHGSRFYWRNEFYVHPETGVLCEGKKKIRKYQRPQRVLIEVENQQYVQHDGLWYRVKMKPVPVVGKNAWGNPEYDNSVRDVFVGSQIAHSVYSNYNYNIYCRYGNGPDGNLQYCCHKESANSKEIKKINEHLAKKSKKSA